MQHDTPPDQLTPVDSFPTDPSGLPEAARPQLLGLGHGDTLDLRVGPVAKRLGDTTVRMLGYNGSIPGPTLKVQQGSEIVVHVINQGDLDTTVHWHGLRLENRYDGVPHETQAPIPVGGEFTYRIRHDLLRAAETLGARHVKVTPAAVTERAALEWRQAMAGRQRGPEHESFEIRRLRVGRLPGRSSAPAAAASHARP